MSDGRRSNGGARQGAGRPRAPGPRCWCGHMLLARAVARGHKCEAITPVKGAKKR